MENLIGAFFDVDGTLTKGRTWTGFLKYFQENKLRRFTHLAYIGYHYPLYFLRKLGFITEGNFRGPWAANMAWYVRGYTLERSKEIWNYTVDYLSGFWREDTLTILKSHQDAGDIVVLVSSGPLPLLQAVGKYLEVDHVVGTIFEVKNGRYTGRSLKPTCIDSYKASMTVAYLSNNDIQVNYGSSKAYADSIADLAMLEMVGNPVVVYPDDELRQEALMRGWQIYPF